MWFQIRTYFDVFVYIVIDIARFKIYHLIFWVSMSFIRREVRREKNADRTASPTLTLSLIARAVALSTGSDPIKIGDHGSKVKVTVSL